MSSIIFTMPDKNHAEFLIGQLAIRFECLFDTFNTMLSVYGKDLLAPRKVEHAESSPFAVAGHQIRMCGIVTHFNGKPLRFSAVNADDDSVEEVLFLVVQIVGDLFQPF